jgi:hypothetical protein
MPWTQSGSAVVLAAQQFNPTIFTQIWLVDQGILAKDDFLEGSLFSDFVVQVRSKIFQMLVIPEQLQFVPSVIPEQQQSLLQDKLATIVKLLPQTPYKALGLNFAWHLAPADGNMERLCRELFFVPDRPLYKLFDAQDSHYGAYLSMNFPPFRLKLDIKPTVIIAKDKQERRLLFSFNFHADLGNRAPDQIIDALGYWDKAVQQTERVVDAVEQRKP